jgi:hypothetical protein
MPLPLRVTLVSVALPALYMPPPKALDAMPMPLVLRVTLVSVALPAL